MRILPVTCFALAAAVAVNMLPASSSYAQTYFNKAQNSGSTGQLPTEGVGNVEHFKGGDRDFEHTFRSKEQEFGSIGDRTRSSSAQDARSNERGGRGRPAR